MFRKNNPPTDSPEAEAEVIEQVSEPATTTRSRGQAVTAGKGRPTPKRSESEHHRRQPYTAPADRKAASKQARDRGLESRSRRADAMRRGEDWALPPRDRGPVKALARDFVDSRRRISEYYMYGLILLMLLLFIHNKVAQTAIPGLVIAAVLVMAIEGFFLGRRVRALVEQRLPGESTRGIRWYTTVRALQLRPLRLPKPRVKPGDEY